VSENTTTLRSAVRVRASELTGRGWLNTGDKSLDLESLRGKIVLLDFWTFCCINCLHVLDELRPLEEEYKDVLVTVGVHSPKFEHEADPVALAHAVERYEIHHPVLDDPELETWQAYTARAWPTLVVLDPEGYIVAHLSGEGHVAGLKSLVAELVAEHEAKGTLHRGDGPYVAPPAREGDLRFPGSAIALPDGTMVHTEGTKDARKSIVATKNGKEIARTDDCEGVHGEAAPHSEGDDVAVFGCESGPVVYRDGDFHKVKVSGYVRNGNLAGSHESPIVLGDHKTKKIDDENAEAEHPTKVALIDSRNDSLTTVELGSSYWFRSLARGPEGEGLVLTYDGKVNVIDVETGKVTKRIDAIKPWKEKKDWQEPGPAIKVAGDKAYVTDAENKQLVVIDLEKGSVTKRIPLAHTPVEMAVVDGVAEAPAHKEAHEGHAH